MIVELHGLEVFGHHGVLESEQREGQTFLFDITLEVEEPADGPRRGRDRLPGHRRAGRGGLRLARGST